MMNVSLGTLLRRHRKAAGLTLKDLATQTSYTFSVISKIERDDYLPSATYLAQMVAALKLSPDEAQQVQTAYEAARHTRMHAAPTNLPARLPPLLGRDDERTALRARVANAALVTLTGPGGSGKTLLALTVAHDMLEQFSDGVFLVRLESVSDPAQVAAEIAKTLNVQAAAGQTVAKALAVYLKEQHMLLLLDNFEQVTAAAPLLIDLLQAAPGLTLLVTSRAALRVSLEQVSPVRPLLLPDLANLPDLATLAHNPAVALFVARAQAGDPTFALTAERAPVIADICVRLDGLPLAIELAAARCALLTPRDILHRLQLDLLSSPLRDVSERQQTLRATLDWSYALLSAAEQIGFVRLGVFVGGCTVAAAEAICADATIPAPTLLNILEVLHTHQLLVRGDAEPGTPSRLTMLETIRVYAHNRLSASAEASIIQQRHANYYLDLAEQRDLLAADTLEGDDLAHVERELPNLRAALAWAAAQPDPTLALRLSSAMCLYWHARHGQREGRHWLERALEHGASTDLEAQARALYAAGYLASDQGDYAQAIAYLQRSLTHWQTLDHPRGAARTLIRLGHAHQNQGDFAAAIAAYSRSLEQWRLAERADDPGLPHALACLGRLAMEQGDFMQADHYLHESQQHYQRQHNLHGVALAHTHLGLSALYQGNFARACTQSEHSLRLLQHQGLTSAFALSLLGLARLLGGDAAAARSPLREALLLRDQQQDIGNLPYCLEGLAGVALADGNPTRATVLASAADALRTRVQAPLPPAGRQFLEHYLALMQAQLDPRQFAAAWTTGQTLSLWEVVDSALDEVDTLPMPRQ
jgi:predicted ATPase/DNA-binding XRE family transcriptional regulator